MDDPALDPYFQPRPDCPAWCRGHEPRERHPNLAVAHWSEGIDLAVTIRAQRTDHQAERTNTGMEPIESVPLVVALRRLPGDVLDWVVVNDDDGTWMEVTREGARILGIHLTGLGREELT